MEKEKIYDLIVIGGGAGGFAAAITASRRGKKVIVLEKEDKFCKKILMSGNGKCNLGNTVMSVERYNTEFVKDVIKTDVRGFFATLGIATRETDGRVYPYSESALTVVNALRKNYTQEAYTEREVDEICEYGDMYICGGVKGRNVLLATGSAATKGTESAFLYAKFGHKIKKFTPSLVPLKTDTAFIKGLSGIRAKCSVTLISDGKERVSREGELLFRENGVSGIVSMSISTFIARKKGKYDLKIDFAPDKTEREVAFFTEKYGAESFLQKSVAQSVEKQAKARGISVSEAVKNFIMKDAECGDMKQAQVACGGLDVSDFDENMQSKLKKGLYACGEVLDVDGECGGYNLHFAFASGIRAGESIC